MSIVPNLQNDSLARHQTEPIRLVFSITGAKAAVILGSNPFQATWGFDVAAGVTSPLGQTTIDNLLSSTNEVIAATAFGSTAMGTDAFGLVVNCDGQLKNIRTMHVYSSCGTAGASVDAIAAGTTTALPNTLPAVARAYCTVNGNFAAQFVLTGLDAATAGVIIIDLDVDLK